LKFEEKAAEKDSAAFFCFTLLSSFEVRPKKRKISGIKSVTFFISTRFSGHGWA
jgi:hypothetical protein